MAYPRNNWKAGVYVSYSIKKLLSYQLFDFPIHFFVLHEKKSLLKQYSVPLKQLATFHCFLSFFNPLSNIHKHMINIEAIDLEFTKVDA